MIIATIVYAVTKLFNIPVFVAIVTLLVKLLLGCNNKPMPSFLVESRKLVKKD